MGEEPRSFFRCGCFGCLGLAGLTVLVLAVLAGVTAISSGGPSDPTEELLTQELPGAATLPERSAGAMLAEDPENDGSAALNDLPATGARDLPIQRLEGLEFPDTGSGTLRLDLAMGEFEITPVAGLDRIEVDAEYDRARFELEQTFTETSDGNWLATVSFGGGGGFGFRSGDNDNRVEIRVPLDHAMSIYGEVKMGRSELELGGLWLENVDLELGMGEHIVTFSEPNPMPLAEFATESSMGATEIIGLGYASPAIVSLEHKMGELKADLEGPWAIDSDIEVRCGMGECRIDVPRDVHLDVDAKVAMGGRDMDLPDDDEIPADAPTLRINARASMGEVRIR